MFPATQPADAIPCAHLLQTFTFSPEEECGRLVQPTASTEAISYQSHLHGSLKHLRGFLCRNTGFISEACAHHYGRDLEHFPGLWAHRQGAWPFSCTLLCKLLHSLSPCLPSQSPSAHPGCIAPQGHFSLPQLLLARPELQELLSPELLAAGRSSLPCLGCSWHQEPPCTL